MRISYDAEHDVLHLSQGDLGVDAEEVSPGILVLYGPNDKPVGATIYDFSRLNDSFIAERLPMQIDVRSVRRKAEMLKAAGKPTATL